MVIPTWHTITGTSGSEPTLLEFRSGQQNSSRTSCNSQPEKTLHPFDGSDRSLRWPIRQPRVTTNVGDPGAASARSTSDRSRRTATSSPARARRR